MSNKENIIVMKSGDRCSTVLGDGLIMWIRTSSCSETKYSILLDNQKEPIKLYEKDVQKCEN